MPDTQDVPPGFEPDPRSSPLLDLLGPVHQRWAPGQSPALGLRVEQRHLNGRGLLHGAVLGALGDVALGRAVALAQDPSLGMVTTTLTTHFIAPVQLGQWVEVAATSVRLTRTQGFVHGAATVGERVVAHLDAVFRAP